MSVFQKSYFCFFLIICSLVVHAADDQVIMPIMCEDDILTCNANDLPVQDLESLLHQQCGIRLLGLKAHPDQTITFHVKGPVLETMKRLLRYLQAESYVFEFNGNELTHVLIYSRGKTSYVPSRSINSDSNQKNNDKVNVVKVLDIVPDSQAEVHGFQKGDYVLMYDSVSIRSASHLVSEVKKKRDTAQRVEMVIMRDGDRLSYILDSGLIGVRIQTVRVDPSEIQ